jgi:hypothetical protein
MRFFKPAVSFSGGAGRRFGILDALFPNHRISVVDVAMPTPKHAIAPKIIVCFGNETYLYLDTLPHPLNAYLF